MTQRRDFYLIFKEAVNNLAKYSGAANATVRVTAEDNTIAMLIKDDGKGFDINTIKPGNGLSNMEQRAKASGSVLDVESVPGEGTTVRLRMKIK